MPALKITNPKINPELVEELQDEPAYANEQAFSATHAFLRRVTRETAKAALNQTINGSRKYRRFVAWFKEQFPLLHGVWERTDMATMGNEISSFYETQLMQDMELYELAERLGLHLTYEYDGCGVMCREDDAEVLAKIQQLIAHVQARSERKWGVRPVIVVKSATDEARPARKKRKPRRPRNFQEAE